MNDFSCDNLLSNTWEQTQTYSNCNLTGSPTLHVSDVRFSHMNVFDKILLITKIAFIQVWWCLTYSLLSLYYSTYEAVLDPINKVREVMRVILPSIKSRQPTIALISLSDPQQWSSEFWHYKIDILFAKVSCSLLSTSNALPEAQGCYFYGHHKILAILWPNYCPA